MTKLRNLLNRRLRDQVGGVSAEYIAVIVIVAAVIAAVWSINIDETVGDCGEAAVDDLFSEDAAGTVDC